MIGGLKIEKCKNLLWLLLILLTAGCSEDETEKSVQLEAPRVVGSTFADGATNIPAGDLTLVFTFDQNVTAPTSGHTRITLPGATVEKLEANLTQVTLKITGLEKGLDYLLTIPQGVILGPTKVAASEIRMGFSTENPVIPETPDEALCTAYPMAQTKIVYDYLLDNYGKKTLSGSMANVSWNIAEAELVKSATGKYPAIAFFDYIHLYASPANWIDYSDISVIEDWWTKNGLVGIGWHWMVPVSENAGKDEVTYDPDKTAFKAANATVEGTWENKTVKADLEKITGYLKLLQDKNIPVIWRPLHEAAGNTFEFNGGKAWFWWGADGAEAYKKLWIYMFDYFQAKGICNLIWVWTTQLKDNTFYPGNAYVDIVGRDIYNQKSGSENALQYETILKNNSRKLIALSECGNIADISAQWAAGARWSFFMPWYQYDATSLVGHQHADESWWKNAMGQDFVISREDLPSMKSQKK